MSNGGWVFISHSHQDVRLVREIRNCLENLGFDPLMFYLRCLSDNDEIEALIKREIDEREWFIYADSPNARASRWVRTEREYIESLSGKRVFTVNLDEDITRQLAEVKRISQQMKVFISYSHKDRELYQRIRQRLIERDMLVLSGEDFCYEYDRVQKIDCDISQACRDGFVLLLITENWTDPNTIAMEIEKAKEENGKIVPVYVGKGTIPVALLSTVGDIQGVHLSEVPTDGQIDEMIESVLHRVEYYANDFTNSNGYRGARKIRLPEISRIDEMTFWDCDNLEVVFIPDSVIYIAPNTFEEHKDILILCPSGSYCERYCKKHNLKYKIQD